VLDVGTWLVTKEPTVNPTVLILCALGIAMTIAIDILAAAALMAVGARGISEHVFSRDVFGRRHDDPDDGG
jgi:hypothetical protein